MTVACPASSKADQSRDALLRQWRTSSDRVIATSLGVSNRTVSLQRKQLEADGLILPRESSTQAVKARQYDVCTAAIEPADLNDELYDPIDEDEPSFKALLADIEQNGILEPIVVSGDGYILSGHRRHAAACVIGLDRIPVRVKHDVSYLRDPDAFLRLLASYNRQRVKTTSEQMREEVALMTDQSYRSVRDFRREASVVNSETVELRGRKRRSTIRDKIELRDAIVRVIHDEQRNWPLSDRAVHYRLLNIPGLVRNDKTRVPYLNNAASYDDVTNMLTRLRLDGSVPFESIADETRPVVLWNTHRCVGDYVRQECDGFLSGYYRSLLQSQPNWIELLVEKNTVASQLRQVAAKYTIPMTSGRGYSSLPPRKNMVDRFRQCGREQLVVVVVSDFDPEGEDIPGSFGISLRDDFGIPAQQLKIVKAALTADQVATLELHEGQISKDSSSRYKRFVREHGERAWELESLSADRLRDIVEASIRDLLDLDAFEAEVAREASEQEELNEKRRQLRQALTANIHDAD
ncbi:ParB N-terminal domain-containing protein [Rubinisphaera margarita]|uniref:ParB N-terminal domain-containing protein n=1 Tax=Rubinisphaera margarita TaxID=2909586 RepID=UPI001EE8EF79|nr:ParB N-terminal domain-containing protein [Rubinisphaera margarita]MCG6158334.1 ParB N-terminal domain-containing protein [Rubinisphaera margarita]